MHGLIFISFRDYLAGQHEAGIAQDVMSGEPVYLLSEAYPDERFNALVERACVETGMERDTLLHDFGVFTAQRTFARLYSPIFAMYPSTRSFLLDVERPIHELVRVAIPNALPPELAVSELGDDGLSIVYTSPRQLCPLLSGLVEGTARHYRETVRVEEQTCMRRGDPACTFEVRVERPTPAQGASSSAVAGDALSPTSV